VGVRVDNKQVTLVFYVIIWYIKIIYIMLNPQILY